MADQAGSEAVGKSPFNIEAKSRSWVLVVVTGLITTAAPLTAAVYGSISKSKELAIAEKDQDFRMRMSFLDRAIEAGRPPEDRRLILRFLRAVMKDEAMTAWANSELQSVEDELDKTKRDLAQARKDKEKAEQSVVEAQENEAEARQQLSSNKSASRAETQKLRSAVEAATKARERAERKLTTIVPEPLPSNLTTFNPKIECEPTTIEQVKRLSDAEIDKRVFSACLRSATSVTRDERYIYWLPTDMSTACRCIVRKHL